VVVDLQCRSQGTVKLAGCRVVCLLTAGACYVLHWRTVDVLPLNSSLPVSDKQQLAFIHHFTSTRPPAARYRTQWSFYGGRGAGRIFPQNLGLPPGCPHFSYNVPYTTGVVAPQVV